MLVDLVDLLLGLQGSKAPLHLVQLCLCMLEALGTALHLCLRTAGTPCMWGVTQKICMNHI